MYKLVESFNGIVIRRFVSLLSCRLVAHDRLGGCRLDRDSRITHQETCHKLFWACTSLTSGKVRKLKRNLNSKKSRSVNSFSGEKYKKPTFFFSKAEKLK